MYKWITPSKVVTLFSCLLAIAMLAGCKKDKIAVPNANLNALFDTWDLVTRSGGLAGTTETPQSMGYQLSVKYDENGTVYWYKDGAYSSKDQFHFNYQDAAHANGTHYTIDYQNKLMEQWVYVHNDTLYLDDAFCDDCYRYVYIRRQ